MRLDLARTGVLVAALLGLTATFPGAEVPTIAGKFVVFDDCAALPGADLYRARLAQAVQQRDVTAFVALTAPNVRLDFGDGAGHAELRDRLSGADGPQLWRELDRILALGCAGAEGAMTFPSIFAHDLGDADVFEIMAIVGSDVPLLDRPDPTAIPMARLSSILVEPVSGEDYEAPYRRVRVPDTEIEGYVSSDKLRSPIDYRMGATRRGGEWQIDFFLAGD